MVRRRPGWRLPHDPDDLPLPEEPQACAESPLRDYESYEREEQDNAQVDPSLGILAPSDSEAGLSTSPNNGGTPYPSVGQPPAHHRHSGVKRTRGGANNNTSPSKRARSKSQDAGAEIDNPDPRVRARQLHKLKHTAVPLNLPEEEYFRLVQERVRARGHEKCRTTSSVHLTASNLRKLMRPTPSGTLATTRSFIL